MSKKGVYKVSPEEAELLARKTNPKLSLNKSSYRGVMHKCEWFEEGILGSFFCRPQSIIRGLTTGHPSLSVSKRKLSTLKNHGVSNIFEKKEYIKNCTFKKHGVDNIFKKVDYIKQCTYAKHGVNNIFEKKEYIKDCIIKKFGVSNVNQTKEIQDKVARSSNKRKTVVHWSTGELLTCIASYEYKTVLYLNKNKINYIWQPDPVYIQENVTYRPDLYLIDEKKFIEIKGYCRPDFLKKWNIFIKMHPTSELWTETVLKSKGIL